MSDAEPEIACGGVDDASSPRAEVDADVATGAGTPVIAPGVLALLRCPVTGAELRQAGAWLVADRPRGAGLRYPIREGIPVLLAEHAELPAGCVSLEAFRSEHAAEPSA